MNSNLFEKEISCLTEDVLQKCHKQAYANEAYATLMYSYGLVDLSKYDGTNKSLVGKSQLTSEDYPDYYGGAYINKDGNLTIYVTEEVEKCRYQIEKATKKKECILKRCHYSYKEMLQVKKEIEKYCCDNPDDQSVKNLIAYGISDMENLIFVEMEDLSPEQISLFKKNICDASMLVFRHGEKVEAETIIRAGEGVSTHAGASSNGFRGKIDNVYGFIMSGHGAGANHLAISLNSNNAMLGTTTHWQWSNSVDAAFVKVNDDVVLSNAIMNTAANHASFAGPSAVNTVIFQSGITTGLTAGVIAAVNVNVRVGMVSMTELVRATYTSAAGDSGGIVYTVSNRERPILGNHIASGPHYGLAANIVQAFGVQLF